MQLLRVSHMKMRLRAITCIMLLSAGLVPAHASPLVVAVEDAAGPWSNRDGTGYANDVVREAFQAVGVKVKFKVVPYARCKHLVVGGDVAACFSMSPEPGLEAFVILSDAPLFIVNFDYFHNQKKPLKVKREDDIPAGTVVGIVSDYEYPESAVKLRKQGVIFEVARDEDTNLRKLALGRIDAAIINHNDIKPVEEMIEKAGAKDVVKFLLRSGTMGSYIGFSKRSPDGEPARKKFNQGFQIIRSNGTLKRIKSRWTPAAAPEAARRYFHE